MKTYEPFHDVEPAWIGAAWRVLVWLNRLALPVLIIAVPAWGFVTALSYPGDPSTYEVVAITLVSLLPFGYFLVLAKEGATPRRPVLAAVANCMLLLVSASPIAKLRVPIALDAGDWIMVGLAPLASSNVSVFMVAYWRLAHDYEASCFPRTVQQAARVQMLTSPGWTTSTRT